MSDNAESAAPGRQTKRGPAVDLDAMTLHELADLAAAVDIKRREKLDQAKTDMLAKWKAEAAEAGLTLDAVMPPASSGAGQDRKPRKDSGDPLPVKYRGPNGETWSGRGRLPNWLAAIEAEGLSRDEFKI